ncbi:MAG TPA: 4-hydroxythreonine-4-phosphate dehydrogenase PdxA, partial [Burkholderiales bacterium]|nr:4-hydroxythreonine-4-phosphate dehydrogenase PdxA [Burkholderiales bacterium]
MGDPAGISPELTAKGVALKEVREAARIVVIGDRRIFDEGARVAGVSPSPEEFVELKHADPAGIRRGVAAKAGGESALANYRHALRMVPDGKAGAVCFTPFNKQAMRMAEPTYDDEILFTSNVLGFKGLATEFNVLEGLWNARVTSHIPLKEVSSALSVERIVEALKLTTAALRAAGFEPPRVGVAGLNPHAGDGGNFGREEIDIIEPAVRKA